jgi:hypothetical protein
MSHSRAEVEAAFQRYWRIGAIEERWADWTDCFTEDVHYVERVYGEMRGRQAVRSWITGLMVDNPHVHAVLSWYIIEGDRVVLHMLNRYYSPLPGGPPLDFPGVTILSYAGDGRFSYEEDWWSMAAGQDCYRRFRRLLAEHGPDALTETPERRAARDPWAAR